MTKQQYVCDAVYSPLANAIADCRVCGWEISRHKTVDSVGKGPFGPEVSEREILGKTIAENTRMRILLRAVTESWVNGRRVLDGIDKTFGDQVRLIFEEHSADHTLIEPIKVGATLFGVGVPLRMVLERIERGYKYAQATSEQS